MIITASRKIELLSIGKVSGRTKSDLPYHFKVKKKTPLGVS